MDGHTAIFAGWIFKSNGVGSGARQRHDAGGGLGADGFDVDGDFDFIADENAAGFEGVVPGESEGAATEFGGGGGTDTQHTPRVFDLGPGAFDFKGDGMGDAVDGEFAGDLAAVKGGLDPGADEGDGREFLIVEEFGALEVSVAVRVPGVDGGDFDGGFDGGGGGILVVEGEGAGDFGELAADVGDHHVADAEVDGGVGGIDGVLDEGHACFSCGCRLDSLRRYAGLDAGCEGWDAGLPGSFRKRKSRPRIYADTADFKKRQRQGLWNG